MPIKIYKTQTFNKIFLCFETKHKKHKTQTQIFGLHAQPNHKQPHNLKFDNPHTFNPKSEAADLVNLWVLREPPLVSAINLERESLGFRPWV